MAFFLVLAGLLTLSSSAAPLPTSAEAVIGEGRDFDYFMFVRQWPGNYCTKHSCPLLHKRGFHFTVHGLWPNYKNGSWPQFCDPDYLFDESEVEDLEDALQEEWPTFYDSYTEFWEHEWSRHGTCALSVLRNQHGFFEAILKLHWKYDLAAALRDADIVPSHEKVYRAKDLADAIEDMYDARPLVHCYDNQLSEIWMCFDKDLRPFDCDPSHERRVCDELTIPPLAYLEDNSDGHAEREASLGVEAASSSSSSSFSSSSWVSLAVAGDGNGASSDSSSSSGSSTTSRGHGSGRSDERPRDADLASDDSDIGAAATDRSAAAATAGNALSGMAAVLASLDAVRAKAAAQRLRGEMLTELGDDLRSARAAAAAAAAAAAEAAASSAGSDDARDSESGSGSTDILSGAIRAVGTNGGAAAAKTAGAALGGLSDDVYDGVASEDSVYSLLEAKMHDDEAMGFLQRRREEQRQRLERAAQQGSEHSGADGASGSVNRDSGVQDTGPRVGAIYLDWLPNPRSHELHQQKQQQQLHQRHGVEEATAVSPGELPERGGAAATGLPGDGEQARLAAASALLGRVRMAALRRMRDLVKLAARSRHGDSDGSRLPAAKKTTEALGSAAALADPAAVEADGDGNLADAEVPNGGAAWGTSTAVSRDFVWTSKLRRTEGAAAAHGAADDDEAVGALAVVSDGDAEVMWAVRGVLVVQSSGGGDAAASTAAKGGFAAAAGGPSPPVWVILLVAVQLACVAVIGIGLAVMAGMAIAGAMYGSAGREGTAASGATAWRGARLEGGAKAFPAVAAAHPAYGVPWVLPLRESQQQQRQHAEKGVASAAAAVAATSIGGGEAGAGAGCLWGASRGGGSGRASAAGDLGVVVIAREAVEAAVAVETDRWPVLAGRPNGAAVVVPVVTAAPTAADSGAGRRR